MRDVYDVIVVGSGATGGWAALELSLAGLSVVVLEAGQALDPNRDFSSAWHYGGTPTPEQVSDYAKAQVRQHVQLRHGAYGPANFHLFADDLKEPYGHPSSHQYNWIRSSKEGGRTLLWRGQTWRMSDTEFAQPIEAETYEGGWPLRYSDLEPYYTRVESFLGVRGTSELVASVPDGAFLDPHPLTAEEIRFKQLTESRWPDVRAIPVRAQVQGRGSRYRDFDRWPRLSSLGSTLALALRTGRVTLVHDAQVHSVTVNGGSSRASGVSYIDRRTHESHTVSARVIMLCASTIATIRILLSSISHAHPAGLGNSSGLLGCYFMDKIGSALTAVVPKRRIEPVIRSDVFGPYGIYLPRISDHFHKAGPQETRGYGIWMTTQDGSSLLSEANAHSRHTIVRMMAFGEMSPRRENRITLEPGLSDRWGQARVLIDCRRTSEDERLVTSMLGVMCALARNAGYEILSESAIPAGLVVHEVGGARMGTSAATSVVNTVGQCWDVPNVFVCDGAAWPSNPFQNPTLTLMSLASRTSRFIVNSFRRDVL